MGLARFSDDFGVAARLGAEATETVRLRKVEPSDHSSRSDRTSQPFRLPTLGTIATLTGLAIALFATAWVQYRTAFGHAGAAAPGALPVTVWGWGISRFLLAAAIYTVPVLVWSFALARW